MLHKDRVESLKKCKQELLSLSKSLEALQGSSDGIDEILYRHADKAYAFLLHFHSAEDLDARIENDSYQSLLDMYFHIIE